MQASRPEDWTRYLQNYTLTSFGRLFPENYDGAIREFWHRQLTAAAPTEAIDLGFELPTPQERQASVAYRALVSRLNELTAQVRELVSDYDKKSPIHNYMNRLMAVFSDPVTASDRRNRQLIVRAGEQLQSHVSKIEHLQAAALTPAAVEQLVSMLERAGCRVTSREKFVYSPEVRIGTALVAQRIDT